MQNHGETGKTNSSSRRNKTTGCRTSPLETWKPQNHLRRDTIEGDNMTAKHPPLPTAQQKKKPPTMAATLDNNTSRRGVGGNPSPLPDIPLVRCWALLLGGILVQQDVKWSRVTETTTDLPLLVLKPARSFGAGADMVGETEIGGEGWRSLWPIWESPWAGQGSTWGDQVGCLRGEALLFCSEQFPNRRS